MVARNCLAVRRGFGRTAVEGVMVGRVGETREVDVLVTAAGQPACSVERFEEHGWLVGVAVRTAGVKLVGQFETADLGAAEAEKQDVAVVGERLAVGYLMPMDLEVAEIPAAVGTGSSSVASLELDRLAHAAERSEAKGLARSEG
jgi:hypothetical protein